MFANQNPELMDTFWNENGPSDGEPDLVPVTPSGCGSCLQDNGTKMLTWKYVGEGQGQFQPKQTYEHVGQGRGSYEKEVVVMPGKWNMQKVVLCVSIPLALALLGGVIFLAMLRRTPQTPEVLRQRPIQVTQYNCDSGADTWAKDWSAKKKDWCCANAHKGCLPDFKGCDTNCNWMGKDFSCGYRVNWGANHRFKGQPSACTQAYNMVAGQCPWCGSKCSLDAALASCHPNR